MSSDTSQAMIRAEDAGMAEGTGTPGGKRMAEGTRTPGEAGMADGTAQTEELLIEEISIDGMCGVY